MMARTKGERSEVKDWISRAQSIKWEIFSSSTWEPEPRRRKVGSWPGEEQEWVKYADG